MFKDENRVPIQRLEMPWRNSENKNDCGIYSMRHMETYFGEGIEEWDSGLVAKNNKDQMSILRVRYTCTIIENPCHELRPGIKKMVVAAVKAGKKK